MGGHVLKPISYLKEEWLEEVGEVGDDNEQDGWYVGGQDGSKQSPDVSFNIKIAFSTSKGRGCVLTCSLRGRRKIKK